MCLFGVLRFTTKINRLYAEVAELTEEVLGETTLCSSTVPTAIKACARNCTDIVFIEMRRGMDRFFLQS